MDKQIIRELIECKSYMIYKWEGEYGLQMPDVRDKRIKELKNEKTVLQNELRKLK